MDGTRIQELFKQEVDAMLDVYKNFEILIPASYGAGADHKGEDGRFVENLIRSFLVKHLPKELEVLTGFIVRPAVKTGKSNRSRKKEADQHSTQLDIIVYNSAQYPVYLRSEETVIVPPEGVISIISVKKTLRDSCISSEILALKNASKLCRCENLRSPYLALVSMNSEINKSEIDTYDWIFNSMKNVYDQDDDLNFNDLIGYVGVFSKWSIFKARPTSENPYEAKYLLLNHKQDEETHLGLQFLLTGILSVYYDKSRTHISRPGFTAFPSGRKHDRELGRILVKYPATIN